MVGYSDSDWAGCRRTARSTSVGALMVGKHLLKSWSSTQKSIALSSGEAELIAAVKLSAELICLLQLIKDWRRIQEGEVMVDSSAALAVTHRRGNGKMRHVKVGSLWIQEKEEREEFRFKKVRGKENPADLLTKNVGRRTLEDHMSRIGLEERAGRAGVGLEVVGRGGGNSINRGGSGDDCNRQEVSLKKFERTKQQSRKDS